MQRNLIQSDQTSRHSALHSETSQVIDLLDGFIRHPIIRPLSLYQLKKFPLQKLDMKQFFTHFVIKSVNLLVTRGWSFQKDLDKLHIPYGKILSLQKEQHCSPIINLISIATIIENAGDDALLKIERLDTNFHILSSLVQEVIQNRNFNYGILDTYSKTYSILCDILERTKKPLPFFSSFNNVYQLEDYLAQFEGEYREDDEISLLKLSDLEDLDIFEDFTSEQAIPQPFEKWVFNRRHEFEYTISEPDDALTPLEESMTWIIEEFGQESLQKALNQESPQRQINKESISIMNQYNNYQFLDYQNLSNSQAQLENCDIIEALPQQDRQPQFKQAPTVDNLNNIITASKINNECIERSYNTWNDQIYLLNSKNLNTLYRSHQSLIKKSIENRYHLCLVFKHLFTKTLLHYKLDSNSKKELTKQLYVSNHYIQWFHGFNTNIQKQLNPSKFLNRYKMIHKERLDMKEGPRKEEEVHKNKTKQDLPQKSQGKDKGDTFKQSLV